ncbi:hypothetical protein N7535_000985 [Penicillium sp. DV-2018c]|nr:hypothetical protein N7461_005771 [Penicillium sp. DV-2018c]KAJ5582365.1 hypothetical protein N7535_000985 [Penicillium sp. DV-2018c]
MKGSSQRYYLPIPKDLWEEPFILISRQEAQGFIDEVNSALYLQLTLTGRGLKRALIDFNGAVVQPTFLGSCNTPEQKDQYEKKVEDFLADWPGWTKIDGKFVKRIMQSVVELRRLKGQPTNLKQEIERKRWEDGMGRLQAHFGLRPPLQAGHEQPPVDVGIVSKWDFHKAPVFISIDLEWKENSPGALTELGISNLHRSRVFLDLDVLNGYSTIVQHNLKDVPGLETMLRCHMPTGNLHNAGNDASYTLQALVRFILKVAGAKPDTYAKHKSGNAMGKDQCKGATSKDVDNNNNRQPN